MVTQTGDCPNYSPDDDDATSGAPQRRKSVSRVSPDHRANAARFKSPITPADSRPSPSVRLKQSQRGSPVSFQDGEKLSSPEPPANSPQGYTRLGFRSPSFPLDDPADNRQWPLRSGDVTAHSQSEARPAQGGLRMSVSMSKIRSKAQSPLLVQRQRTEHQYHNPNFPRLSPHMSADLQDNEILRSSLNSGITSGSSIEHASGTERSSSVWTKHSSITDLSPDGLSETDEGMSVEDAIAMYLDESNDMSEDVPLADIPEVPNVAASSNEHKGKHGPSESPIARDSDSVDESKTWPERRTGSVNKSAEDGSIMSAKSQDQRSLNCSPESISVLPGEVPPSLLTSTETHDQYGFRKATHYIPLSQYESWTRPYSTFLRERKMKWTKLLEDSGLSSMMPITFPPKSSKIKRYVRKGIPSEYRGSAWFYYAGGFDHLYRNPGYYERLVKQAMESPTNDDKEHIERDLHRTFPDNIHFKPEAQAQSESGSYSGSSNPKYRFVTFETQMIQSLRRVLYAFALHNPRIGYTQSLNFITGLLLLFLPEERAFWLLHIITSQYLPGTHEISLEGANIDLWILMILLKESMPGIYAKLASAGPTVTRTKPPTLTLKTRLPDITLGLTNWLMSLFIGSLPLETTLRVWDVFFYEGSKTFFRVALAIFKASEKEILAVSDPTEVFQIVQTVPKRILDVNSLLEDSFTRRYRVGQGRINSLREARRAAIREEKMRLSLIAGKQLASTERTSKAPRTRPWAKVPFKI